MNTTALLNRIAYELNKGKNTQAKKHFNLAWGLKEEMSNEELKVLYGHREQIYGRPFTGFEYDEKANYYEGRILARQNF